MQIASSFIKRCSEPAEVFQLFAGVGTQFHNGFLQKKRDRNARSYIAEMCLDIFIADLDAVARLIPETAVLTTRAECASLARVTGI